MTFSINGYIFLLKLLNEKGYIITDYLNWREHDKCVILRHDIDIDLQHALEIAQIEYTYGIKSVYFVLLTSNFYNIFSHRNRCIIKKICDMGHMIGLHFDEAAYLNDMGNADKIVCDIKKELDILSSALETEISVFSYHRPTKAILDADIHIPNVINSYSNLFFRQFKYFSDSRMNWKEPIIDIICEALYPRLQILIHPFWYYEKEKDIRDVLCDFLNRAKKERYENLNDNLTNLREIIEKIY